MDFSIDEITRIKERHEDRLLGMRGVVGVAVGLNEGVDDRRIVIKVFVTAGPRAAEIPNELEGVPVQVEASGEFGPLGSDTD